MTFLVNLASGIIAVEAGKSLQYLFVMDLGLAVLLHFFLYYLRKTMIKAGDGRVDAN